MSSKRACDSHRHSRCNTESANLLRIAHSFTTALQLCCSKRTGGLALPVSGIVNACTARGQARLRQLHRVVQVPRHELLLSSISDIRQGQMRREVVARLARAGQLLRAQLVMLRGALHERARVGRHLQAGASCMD